MWLLKGPHPTPYESGQNATTAPFLNKFPFGITWLWVGGDFSAVIMDYLHLAQSEKANPINCFESYAIFVTVTLNTLLNRHNVHFIEISIKHIF